MTPGMFCIELIVLNRTESRCLVKLHKHMCIRC